MTLKILPLTTQLIVMSFKDAGNKIRANMYGILLCAKHWCKHFNWIITSDPYNNPKKCVLINTDI